MNCLRMQAPGKRKLWLVENFTRTVTFYTQSRGRPCCSTKNELRKASSKHLIKYYNDQRSNIQAVDAISYLKHS